MVAFSTLSCTKSESTKNTAPTCTIISPANGTEILQGQKMMILVDANDIDDGINQVKFEINGIGVHSDGEYPYEYNWNTEDKSIGSHTIIATAKDNAGSKTSSEITIFIGEDNSELITGKVTDFDGNSYKTIKIGFQWWMAENLKTTHFADGTAINLTESNFSWDSLGDTDKSYCFYANSSINETLYGALYTWAAAMNGAESNDFDRSPIQGACPDGWHLPTNDEWKELEMYLGMTSAETRAFLWRGTNEGDKLKAQTGWYQNGNGNNETGFTALPAGIRMNTGEFRDLTILTHFWSSTEIFVNENHYVWNRSLSYDQSKIGQFFGYHFYGLPKDYGLSIRCVKN